MGSRRGSVILFDALISVQDLFLWLPWKCFGGLIKPDLFQPRDSKHLKHPPAPQTPSIFFFLHSFHQLYQISKPRSPGLCKDSIMFNICCSASQTHTGIWAQELCCCSYSSSLGFVHWLSAHCGLLIRNEGNSPLFLNTLSRFHFLHDVFFLGDKSPWIR